MNLIHRKGNTVITAKRQASEDGLTEIVDRQSTTHPSINKAKAESRRLQNLGFKWEAGL